MKTGTVKHWNEQKGFGFITPEAKGMPDIFVHVSALKSKAVGLKVADSVSYDVTNTPKGERATDVNVLRRLTPEHYVQRRD